MAERRISFVLQASPLSVPSWTELAATAEARGFDALCVADHPGLSASPFVALASAAAVTERIGLGTAVVNGGVCDPLTLASDVATLDRLSGGRAVLGLGAGHTPAEWTMSGRSYPSPPERVDRFAELLATVPRLVAGETVTFSGEHVRLADARLEFASGRPVPLLVGGSNSRLLRLGAEHADIVEISGTGRTLPDGHYHEARWSQADVARSTDIVHEAAGRAGRRPVLGALVQFAEVTDDPEAWVAARLGEAAGVVPEDKLPSVADALDSPYTLVGSVAEIVAKAEAVAQRWGITRFTVRSMDAIGAVMAARRGTDPAP